MPGWERPSDGNVQRTRSTTISSRPIHGSGQHMPITSLLKRRNTLSKHSTSTSIANTNRVWRLKGSPEVLDFVVTFDALAMADFKSTTTTALQPKPHERVGCCSPHLLVSLAASAASFGRARQPRLPGPTPSARARMLVRNPSPFPAADFFD
eukprot:352421-Chlamydomonas_euryale.AAC.97